MNLILHKSDIPVRTAQTARLRRIQAKARASESVVNLLASIAFGPDESAGWPITPPSWAGTTAMAESCA